MVAFVLFWAAFLAIICFVLKAFFKALSSGCNALLSSLNLTVWIGLLVSAVLGMMYIMVVSVNITIHLVQDYAPTDNLVLRYLTIFAMFLMSTLIAFIPVGLGMYALSVVSPLFANVICGIIPTIASGLNRVTDLFDRGYIKSIKKLINQLAKY